MTRETALLITAQNTITPPARKPAAIDLASPGSAQSRRTMRAALDTTAGIISQGRNTATDLPWEALRFQHTQAIRAALSERFKYTTANKMLSALRGVIKVAYQPGYLSPDDYARASEIKSIQGQSVPAGRELGRGEMLALVNVCKADKTTAGARDAALIGVLYSCGLRRAELAALDLADVDVETGRMTIHSGKGRKAHTVYTTGGGQTTLEAWIAWRGLQARPLFCSVTKGHRLTGRRMTAQAVYFILRKRAEEAGLKAFSPHDLRRTFVGEMIEAGADIATFARLAGHASVTTTARYDRCGEEAKRKAAGLLHFPF